MTGSSQRTPTAAPRIDRDHYLFGVLVSMYARYPVAIAAMCDERLDTSGRLLGEVRDAAQGGALPPLYGGKPR